MEWMLLEKGIWFGAAAIGFSVLFNVPGRAVLPVCLIAAAGGLAKEFLIYCGVGGIAAALAGSALIGMLSIAAAHDKHAPALIFSIPAIIPMVPGSLAYRMMGGLIKLAGDTTNPAYASILYGTVNNGIKVVFTLIALAIGVSIPHLISRKTSTKKIHM